LKVEPRQVGHWIFCDGPGSILGIRTVAMALRTWRVVQSRPIFCYSSLELVARAQGSVDLAVIADARRDLWHHYRLGQGLRRLPISELGENLTMPENFRHWSELPPGVRRVPYLISELLPKVWNSDILRATDAPDAFLHEEPSYVTWTPQVHRAPAL
jgi:tRNA threonylcarbamoyladenosine biosynthesis protein TsaB